MTPRPLERLVPTYAGWAAHACVSGPSGAWDDSGWSARVIARPTTDPLVQMPPTLFGLARRAHLRARAPGPAVRRISPSLRPAGCLRLRARW